MYENRKQLGAYPLLNIYVLIMFLFQNYLTQRDAKKPNFSYIYRSNDSRFKWDYGDYCLF